MKSVEEFQKKYFPSRVGKDCPYCGKELGNDEESWLKKMYKELDELFRIDDDISMKELSSLQSGPVDTHPEKLQKPDPPTFCCQCTQTLRKDDKLQSIYKTNKDGSLDMICGKCSGQLEVPEEEE